jgi:hypothetical protein
MAVYCIISHVTHQNGPSHIVESEVFRQKKGQALRPAFENIHANEIWASCITWRERSVKMAQ